MTDDQVVAWLREVFEVDRNPEEPIPVPVPLMRELAERRRNKRRLREAERREEAS